jgi:hypothetical protein
MSSWELEVGKQASLQNNLPFVSSWELESWQVSPQKFHRKKSYYLWRSCQVRGEFHTLPVPILVHM